MGEDAEGVKEESQHHRARRQLLDGFRPTVDGLLSVFISICLFSCCLSYWPNITSLMRNRLLYTQPQELTGRFFSHVRIRKKEMAIQKKIK